MAFGINLKTWFRPARNLQGTVEKGQTPIDPEVVYRAGLWTRKDREQAELDRRAKGQAPQLQDLEVLPFALGDKASMQRVLEAILKRETLVGNERSKLARDVRLYLAENGMQVDEERFEPLRDKVQATLDALDKSAGLYRSSLTAVSHSDPSSAKRRQKDANRRLAQFESRIASANKKLEHHGICLVRVGDAYVVAKPITSDIPLEAVELVQQHRAPRDPPLMKPINAAKDSAANIEASVTYPAEYRLSLSSPQEPTAGDRLELLEPDGTIAGHVSYTKRGKYLELHKYEVDPSWRGRHLSNSLMAELLRANPEVAVITGYFADSNLEAFQAAGGSEWRDQEQNDAAVVSTYLFRSLSRFYNCQASYLETVHFKYDDALPRFRIEIEH